MKVFTNVAALVAATLTTGQIVETKGYTASGDGGAGRYLVKTAVDFGGTPDEKNDFTLANGNVAMLMRQKTATTVQLEDVTHAINTEMKSVGMMIFNTTTLKPVYAAAELATSVWVDATGATVHTPV